MIDSRTGRGFKFTLISLQALIWVTGTNSDAQACEANVRLV